jgi:2-haloacid dehalogenase
MTETLDVLRREVKVLTFDQYGTIVDMQKGLLEAVTPFLKRKGWDGKPNSFVTWWRRTHFENSESRDSQISFSVTYGWSAFGGAGHG